MWDSGFASASLAASVADLDGDTVPDLVTANRNSDDVSVLLGNGDGTFQAAVSFPAGEQPSSLAVADLDGDTVPDLVTANEVSDDVSVLLSQAPEPDGDGDGIPDAEDNCTEVPNANQRDSNGDGYGNACDADLNDDGMVDFLDLGLLKAVFFTSDADADFNGDQMVDFLDLGRMKALLFRPPGPAGLLESGGSAGARPVPCGLGYELAFLLPLLTWLHGRRRRTLACH